MPQQNTSAQHSNDKLEKEVDPTYVKLRILLRALLDSALVGFTGGLRDGAFGARIDTRGAEGTSCAEGGAADD